jgi:hypothetical protein
MVGGAGEGKVALVLTGRCPHGVCEGVEERASGGGRVSRDKESTDVSLWERIIQGSSSGTQVIDPISLSSSRAVQPLPHPVT